MPMFRTTVLRCDSPARLYFKIAFSSRFILSLSAIDDVVQYAIKNDPPQTVPHEYYMKKGFSGTLNLTTYVYPVE